MDSLECLHAQKRKHALLLRSVPQWGPHVVSPVCFSSPFSGNYWPNLAQLCTGDTAGVCIETPLHHSPPQRQREVQVQEVQPYFPTSAGSLQPATLWAFSEEKQLICCCIQPPTLPRHTPSAPLHDAHFVLPYGRK